MIKLITCTLTTFSLLSLLTLIQTIGWAQEPDNAASVNTSIGSDGTGTIAVEAHGQLPKPPEFFTSVTNAKLQSGSVDIEQAM